MSFVESDPHAARLELVAAELLLRSLPRNPALAQPHLDRAAEHLGLPSGRGDRADARSAWQYLSELGRSLRQAERSSGADGPGFGRWLVLALAVVLVIAASVLLTTPRITDTRQVGAGDIIGDLDGEGPHTVVIEGGRQLLVHLDSIWHEPSVGISLDHNHPCRITVLRRGRPLWHTTLSRDEASTGTTYELVLSARAQRRGIDQIVITPDAAEKTIRVGGLRLGSQ